MSIPGLGQIPTQPAPSATRTIRLQRFWEWRFQVSSPPITVRLLSGTAERDGTELALNQPYVFSHTKSKLFTWQGCEVEVDGACDEHVAQLGGGDGDGDGSPMVSYMNLHLLLAAQRKAAARGGHGAQGPRVMVCGPRDCGQTALCRTLAAWGVKMGHQTCMVNAEPREGMLSLPGTLSAAVYATVVDLEGEGSGWGGTPSSGPSAVPVKLPLVYYHGYQRAQDDAERFNVLATRLAGAVTGRMLEDPDVRSAGLIIDAPVVNLDRPDGIEVLAHLVEEFSVNIVVVLGSDELNQALLQRLAAEKTSLGEPISVVKLEQSSGAVERDEAFLQHIREATIKEYFFGDAKRTLSPLTQQADFDGLTVYKTPEPASSHHGGLEKVDNPSSLSHWTLAIMNASPHDSTETIQNATVMGFVYVADVDAERRRLKILAPVSGRLGDRPLVWGRWPEPYINLLG